MSSRKQELIKELKKLKDQYPEFKILIEVAVNMLNNNKDIK